MGLEHKLSDSSASIALGLCCLTDVERGIQAARQDIWSHRKWNLWWRTIGLRVKWDLRVAVAREPA